MFQMNHESKLNCPWYFDLIMVYCIFFPLEIIDACSCSIRSSIIVGMLGFFSDWSKRNQCPYWRKMTLRSFSMGSFQMDLTFQEMFLRWVSLLMPRVKVRNILSYLLHIKLIQYVFICYSMNATAIMKLFQFMQFIIIYRFLIFHFARCEYISGRSKETWRSVHLWNQH